MSVGVLVLIAAIALAGCSGADGAGGGSRPASSAPAGSTTNVYLQARADGVERLLASLSQQLTGGTAAQLDALIDPSASAAFRTVLHTVQDNLSASRYRPDQPPTERGTRLQLKGFRYRLAPTEEAEILAPASVQDRLSAQGSSDTWVAPVELHVALGGARVPGIDEDPVVINTVLVAARYDDSWKVVGDARIVDEAPPRSQMWDLPGLSATDVATRGGSSVVASYPDTAALVHSVRSLLPGAVDAVTAWWGPQWPGRAVVVATATDAEFGALAGSGAEIGGAAAASVYARVDLVGQIATGQRIVLTPGARELPEPALAVVLRHELTHIAARASTATTAPMWLTEGVAEYVGRKGTYVRPADAAPDLAAAVRAGEAPEALPTDQQFAIDSDTSRLAYQSAWSVAAFVADRFGEAKLKALYVGVAATGDTGRQDSAISTTLGIDRPELVRRWHAWLTENIR